MTLVPVPDLACRVGWDEKTREFVAELPDGTVIRCRSAGTIEDLLRKPRLGTPRRARPRLRRELRWRYWGRAKD